MTNSSSATTSNPIDKDTASAEIWQQRDPLPHQEDGRTHKPQDFAQQLTQLEENDSSTYVAPEQPQYSSTTAMDPMESGSQIMPGECSSSEAAAEAQIDGNDIITLNVGGRLFSCMRRTLCLVEESLLALMFGGRWPGGGTTDASGHQFLDLDPQLFEIVLNWLRQFNMSRGGNIHEPDVPADKMEHMVAMLDYLQLHRHIPLTYHEAFDAAHCSPFMVVQGATATRTAVAGQRGGKQQTKPRNALMQFAVSDHQYFDMTIDITLDIVKFQESVESHTPTRYMFVGFMHQAAAAELDPAGDINTQLTKAPGCYGWLVGNHAGYAVRNGKKSELPCNSGLMWAQGDHITLTLDTRRDLPHASISLLNAATGLCKTIEATAGNKNSESSSKAEGSSSTTTAAADDDADGSEQQSQQQRKGRKTSRPGLRHRVVRIPLFPPTPERDEILDILRGQPLGRAANLRVGELVVGAALQLLEAQGFGIQQSLDILRRPGLVQRLVQQVTNVMQVQGGVVPALRRDLAAAAGGQARHAVQDDGTARQDHTTDGAGAAPHPQQSEGQQQQEASSSAIADGRLRLPNGAMLPLSTAEYEWVLVVGLVHPKDSVRIVSARRKGQRPCLA